MSATGAIAAGGGNGGAGGKGGNGDGTGTYSATQFSVANCYVWGAANSAADGAYRHAWGCGTQWDSTGENNVYSWNGSYIYVRVQYQYEKWWSIRRALYYTGVGGAGGAGGQGRGYNVEMTNGSPGLSGTQRSGTGGGGGNGGNWGQDGATGNTGGSGLYHNIYNASLVRAGSAGTAGTKAGKAIVSTSAVQVYGINSPQARALNL